MKYSTTFAIFVITLLVSCGSMEPNIRVPDDTNDCPAACDKLRELGCDEADDIALLDGMTMSCEVFCTTTQKKGHALNPSCIKSISSCSEVSAVCGQ